MILSELDADGLLKVAQALAGHQTNKIEHALEKYILSATPDLVRRDLERIGVVQCKGCTLWFWADQVTEGYCHSLCENGGNYARVNENRAAESSEDRTRQRKFSLSTLFGSHGERRTFDSRYQ